MGVFDNLYNEKLENSSLQPKLIENDGQDKACPDNHQISTRDDKTRSQKEEDRKIEKTISKNGVVPDESSYSCGFVRKHLKSRLNI